MILNSNEALAELCRRSFYTFLQEFWDVIIPEPPVFNWHIKYICDELQYLNSFVVKREPKPYDLVINIPPGTTKSTIITQMYNAWVWTIDPKQRFISASYSHTLSLSHSMKTRDIITSDKYLRLFPNIKLKPDQAGKNDFWNLEGGQRFTTSTNGTVTGVHAHQIVVDDPMNPKQASSEVERITANEFITSTLSTRKVNKEMTPTILIMQRLHEEDTTGIFIKNRKVKHIVLPSELNDNVQPIELREKYIDGLLDPIRLPISVLKESKNELGTYGYSGQYDQKPTPSEGGEWKKDWFSIISEKELQPNLRWELFIDGAYTKESKNDPTGIQIGAKVGNDYIIYSSIDKYLELPELIKFINTFVESLPFKISMINVEPKASGKSIVQLLKSHTALNVVEIKSKMIQMSKIERARTVSPYIESGRVKLVKGNWNDNYLGQVTMFPNAKHDEHIDITCYGIERFLMNQFKTVFG